MTPQDALAYLSGRSPSSIKMGLGRVREALVRLGNPEQRFPALQIAGTNGKGSTCAFVEAALRAQGYRVALYTSPHLLRVNERFRLFGEDVSDGRLGQAIADVLAQLPADHDLTYFELGTVVAFWLFAEEKVDLAVMETGLGGRLDAVTATKSIVTAITPIAFDHMEYLGHSLDAIAREKAGIFKPGVPAVLAKQEPEALRALEDVAARVGAPVTLEGRDFEAPRGVRWSLRGPHQAQNAAVAAECLRQLKPFPVSDENLRLGFETARWPGRLEEIARDPLVVVDGAHNPAGVEVLLRALDAEYPNRPVHLVFGVLGDKDHLPMIERLFPRCAAVYLTPVPSSRSREPASYLSRAKELAPRVEAFVSPEQALKAAREAATGQALVLGAGSLVLVGQLKTLV